MTSINIVPSYEGAVHPQVSKATQAGQNLSYGRDLDLAVQGGKLWYNMAGTRHSYVWPESAVAPVATITATDTAVDFLTTSGEDLEIPWHVTPKFSSIFALVTVAATGSIDGTHLALETRALWDSKSTDLGVYTRLVPSAYGRSPMRLWNSGNDYPAMYNVGLRITPTFDSTREMVIAVKAIWAPSGSNPVGSTGLSTSRVLRIVSMQVADRY